MSVTKVLLGGLFTYARIVFLDSSDMADISRTIERERATAVVWVPTLANRLLRYEGRKDYDLTSLKRMYTGGGASLPDLIRAIQEESGCACYNGYGGTEGQTTIRRTQDGRP